MPELDNIPVLMLKSQILEGLCMNRSASEAARTLFSKALGRRAAAAEAVDERGIVFHNVGR
jgi:hypothetical protein